MNGSSTSSAPEKKRLLPKVLYSYPTLSQNRGADGVAAAPAAAAGGRKLSAAEEMTPFFRLVGEKVQAGEKPTFLSPTRRKGGSDGRPRGRDAPPKAGRGAEPVLRSQDAVERGPGEGGREPRVLDEGEDRVPQRVQPRDREGDRAADAGTCGDT
eukprot:gene13236-biopygen10384